MIRSGKLRGSKVQYEDGIGCCVWFPFGEGEDEDEDCGIAFDFPFEDIDDFIGMLEMMKLEEAEIYNEN